MLREAVIAEREPATDDRAPGALAPKPLLFNLVLLLRPKQWAKNLLVFAAYIFTAGFHSGVATREVLIAFVAISLASSFVYVLNDLLDVKQDRLHPKKKSRPIASGAVPLPAAYGLAFLALAGSIALVALLSHTSMTILATYLVLQVLYNAGLKKVAVADVFIISLGFVLRAALGAAALSVHISSWLLFCTGALALMLGFAKRRSEFILLGERRAEVRASLAAYSRSALDALVIMFACGAALCYGVYAVQSPTARQYPALILTSVFVFYGICTA